MILSDLARVQKSLWSRPIRQMDTYFDFLKKSISAFPSGGTEIGDRWKEQKRVEPYRFPRTREEIEHGRLV